MLLMNNMVCGGQKNIHLDKAIKSTGVHEVDAKLGHGIHAILKIEVIGIE